MTKSENIVNIIQGRAWYSVQEIKTLKDLLKLSEKRFGNEIAFRYRNNPHLSTISKTYREFVRDVNAFGTALTELGLSNSHIAIIGENRYEWIVSYLSAANGAGVAVPLDKMLPPNEIELMLERGEVDVLVYSDAFQTIAEEISKRSTRLKALICMNPSDDKVLEKTGFYSFYKLLDYGSELMDKGCESYTNITVDPYALSVLLFTSGTSSASKAVMLSHHNICSDIMGLGGIVHFKPGNSVLSILPLHHTFENTTGLLFPLYLGMTISIGDGLKYLSRNLTEYKPDCLIGVPLVFDKFKNKLIDELKKKNMLKKVKALMTAADILRHIGPDIRRKLFKKLIEPFGGKLRVIVTGGAPMETETVIWYEKMGIKVYQGYGLTETSPVVAGGNDRIRKAGTCGVPLPGVKIAVYNPDITGTGELVVQGNNVMIGYWKNEKATKEALRDGWFHTGDLGRIDRKGLVRVTGRVKSMIVLKNGKKVFPEELESHINKLEYVKESLVWGETSKDGVVDICAKIILDRDNLPDTIESPEDETKIRKLLDSAIKEINRLMPAYKTIRYYVFGYKELIKTTSMKVKRYVETDQLRILMEHMATTIKKAAGKNIDRLKEMFSEQKAASYLKG